MDKNQAVAEAAVPHVAPCEQALKSARWGSVVWGVLDEDGQWLKLKAGSSLAVQRCNGKSREKGLQCTAAFLCQGYLPARILEALFRPPRV